MQTITKNCADSLRAFAESRGVKLKASHAHELFAAYVGYKSKASMLADALCPIENLSQANIYVLTPSEFINERRKCLEDLPSDLPDTNMLGESMTPTIEEAFGGKATSSFVSFAHLTEALAGECIKKHAAGLMIRHSGAQLLFDKPLYHFIPKVEADGNEVRLMASNRYYARSNGPQPFLTFDFNFTIRLQRIAGHVGYNLLEISVAS